MNRKRLKLAFIFAPSGPTLYFVALSILSDFGYRPVVMISLLSLPISYLSCLLFGIPLLKFLRSRGALSAISVVVIGSLLGIVVNYLCGHLLGALLDSSAAAALSIHVVKWGVIFGGMVAIPFALIAGLPLRPVRDGGNKE